MPQILIQEEPMVRELVGTRVVKAFRARDASVLEEIREWAVDTFFLDTWSPEAAGGTGRPFDWDLGRRASEIGNMILAGGLNAENVRWEGSEGSSGRPSTSLLQRFFSEPHTFFKNSLNCYCINIEGL
jgi:phosphoribosylanthranilate isomerase